MEKQDQVLTSFKEIVQKAVNTKTKTGLRSSIIIQNLDARCLRSYYPSHNTFLKMQT